MRALRSIGTAFLMLLAGTAAYSVLGPLFYAFGAPAMRVVEGARSGSSLVGVFAMGGLLAYAAAACDGKTTDRLHPERTALATIVAAAAIVWAFQGS